jgi:hypothetical protein
MAVFASLRKTFNQRLAPASTIEKAGLGDFFRSGVSSGITGTTLSPGVIRPDSPTVIPCAGQNSVCGHFGEAHLMRFVFAALAARKKNVLNAGFRKRIGGKRRRNSFHMSACQQQEPHHIPKC